MQQYSILIVEDDEITALNLKLSLTKHGYRVVDICSSVEEAINSVNSFKPDLVIIDISLQEGRDGIELASMIRNSYALPFIFLTSHSDDDIINDAIETEPYGYILKPFDPSSLHATIQMAVFKHGVENKRFKELEKTKMSEESLNKVLYEKRDKDRAVVCFCDDYYLDLEDSSFYFLNKKLTLTKKESIILKLLVAKGSEMVSFKEAIEYVWRDKEASENSIRTLIWRLRTKLPTGIIKNASGIGYYLA